MSCCDGPCVNPGNCQVCRWLSVPQRPPGCTKTVNGEPCRLIAQHRGPCLPPRQRTKSENVNRDGEINPGTDKRRDPTFTPRRRKALQR